ncbi:MAG TPA: hypothetical protein VFH73_14470, partial [Polyangia bacterium]|nr:hypothetical protein [Polyangia bacterium]
DGRLVVFFARIKAAPGQGLGFQADGWRAVLIDNPDADPQQWNPQFLAEIAMPPGLNLATALVRRGDQVFGLAVREPGDHAGFVARWPAADLAAGRLDAMAWWDGSSYAAGATPAVVLADAGPECSLHFDERLGKFVFVRSDGFGKTTVAISFADHVEGPWPAPRPIFRPPEDDQENAFVYAAKAHPFLSGADLVASYATNTFAGLPTLRSDTTIYYPRFVKLTITP